MKRQIIEIDEEKCTGCGICADGCHEGALQIINGKAVLINDLLCDGLGACIGTCPEGAIEITERDAEPYDEDKVMEHLYKKGKDVVIAHLKHLKDHNEHVWLKKGVDWMQKNQDRLGFDMLEVIFVVHNHSKEAVSCNCSGSAPREIKREVSNDIVSADQPSALEQWPVQMHLINPQSSAFVGADLLMAADCVAFSMGNFHSRWLKGKKLAIACPKLDSNKESYIEKLISMIDDAKVNTITVMMMEVPCCHSLLKIVQMALEKATRKVPVKAVVVSAAGDVLGEEWI